MKQKVLAVLGIVFLSSAYLSEDVAGQRLIQTWLLLDELKQVHAVAVLLHHHLEEQLVLKHLQHLGAQHRRSSVSSEQ